MVPKHVRIRGRGEMPGPAWGAYDATQDSSSALAPPYAPTRPCSPQYSITKVGAPDHDQ